ncbi:hypothetical protein FYK55_00850 [Roseiconus nitratireducens]|uniref:Uncharacterized protein n=1 Tax=Roseiconus nitratireducens TaxID=2605748 RepID=A0A5M6DHH8_9BACT|nr:hypothetical protein [Roseiconus nitratireducens]KAA5546998.1 hypothetical protein FYK55_00850 [Roseiconus nitratireducens]
MHRVDELRSLNDGWDDDGAIAPSEDAIHVAKQFIRRGWVARNVPEVRPTADGGLQFDWRAGDRSLEIEVEADGSVYFLKSDFSNDQFEEDEITQPASGSQGHVRAYEDRIKGLLTWVRGE